MREEDSLEESVGEAEAEIQDLVVPMNSFQRLNIPKDDKKTYVVRTEAVFGCDAVLVWKVDPTTGDEILLTHYPPTQLEQHRKVLKENSSDPGEVMKVVYLNMVGKGNEIATQIKNDLEGSLGVVPEEVSLVGLPTESIKGIQNDPILYQLVATKGYNGNPDMRRVVIPLPEGNAYESIF